MSSGARFEFGKNWQQFLRGLNEERMAVARRSLQEMLGLESLAGRSFLDVGSGSGLFSLAARQLGARVRSFDFDPQSVACTRELRERYFPGDADWMVEEGSILDGDYVGSLGRYDLVYSWGVLHHTGAMWRALENVSGLVADDGMLCIAIYNDQGTWSRRWKTLKRIYNRLPGFLQGPYAVVVMGVRDLKSLIGNTLRLRPQRYFQYWTNYSASSGRGMSYWRDLVDWIGGYPFEVAKPEEIFRFYRDHDFHLRELITCGAGLGCNQYVFIRQSGKGR
ncbi:MAG TPA: class I SAM-dependent methyltransferase [Gammaproteobacteria bacterium]|nr:class I SAM-dependent methyltransferase [Gammaproteobacteria bacterium]